MKFRLLLPFLVAAVITLHAQTPAPQPSANTSRINPAPAASKADATTIDWHDVTTWGVEGRAWESQERARWFDRFPASAEKTVTPDVWRLSRYSTGMMVRFETDATEIHVDYELSKKEIARPTMPATGVSGVDLYARDAQGKWRWVQVSRPTSTTVKTALMKDIEPGHREYALYLPLYNGVEFLKIGVPTGTKFKGLVS